jgi:hypothetical protein
MTLRNDKEATRVDSNRLDASQPMGCQRVDINPVTAPLDGLPAQWRLFPCHYIADGRCSCGDLRCGSPGKHPRTRNGMKDATNNADQLRAWYEANPLVNWGLATGAVSGLFVIDLDVKENANGLNSLDNFERKHSGGVPFPTTTVVDTGSGGRHLYFEHPGGVVQNRVNWLPGVDVRGDGGYVIIPPSTHLSGQRYVWRSWASRPLPAPAYLLAALKKPVGRFNSRSGSTSLAAVDALPSTDDALRDGLQMSSRNSTLHRLACRWWGTYGLNGERAVLDLARQVWLATADRDSFPWSEALKAVESARRFIEEGRKKDLEAIRALIGGRK